MFKNLYVSQHNANLNYHFRLEPEEMRILLSLK